MKRKKVIRMRGSKTHGYGSKKKHRGAGSRGGRGYAGSKKHKKTWIRKYEPGHIGKRGFKSLRQRGLKKAVRTVNVSELERLAEGKKEIDLGKQGYDKVLGSGQLRKPLIVKAAQFSKRAGEKIKKVKGKAIKI
jgi:large subunit ribosomal protein L15